MIDQARRAYISGFATKLAGSRGESVTAGSLPAQGSRVAQGPSDIKRKRGIIATINSPAVQSLDDIFYIVQDLAKRGAI